MTLIIGYGNILRSDDGIGIFLAKQIAEKHLSGVVVKTIQQLHVELLEEMIGYERTIFIDAAGHEEEMVLKKLHPECEYGVSSSHFTSPQLLLEMARTVYGRDLDLYICSVKGENFDLGDGLSAAVRRRGKKALQLIHELLKKNVVLSPVEEATGFRCTECEAKSCGVVADSGA